MLLSDAKRRRKKKKKARKRAKAQVKRDLDIENDNSLGKKNYKYSGPVKEVVRQVVTDTRKSTLS